ncbi:C6 zinc finger domain-containing protein [Colletotrichum asianum]
MLHSVAIILLYAATTRAQVKIPDENPIVQINLNATADLEPNLSATIINYLHTREFPTPKKNSIMTVNVDVLYSFGVLNLSEADVLLGVPEFDNQISNINRNTARTYHLKRNAISEVSLANSSLINISTAYASVAILIGINSNTTAELDRLHSF